MSLKNVHKDLGKWVQLYVFRHFLPWGYTFMTTSLFYRKVSTLKEKHLHSRGAIFF